MEEQNRGLGISGLCRRTRRKPKAQEWGENATPGSGAGREKLRGAGRPVSSGRVLMAGASPGLPYLFSVQ